MNNIYRNALDAQSACNLSALVKQLALNLDIIWEEAMLKNLGTEYVNRHSVVIMYLNQMLFLSLGRCIEPNEFSKANLICESLADIKEILFPGRCPTLENHENTNDPQ